MEFLGNWKRTDYCGNIDENWIDKEVTVMGWVFRRRDHGGVIFVDLRDREGLLQIVFDPTINADVHQKAEKIRTEYVIAVRGVIRNRPAGTENPNLRTGKVELAVSELKILSESLPMPFSLEEGEIEKVGENIRLKYRYLDLRSENLKNSIIFRHKISSLIRNYLNNKGFIDIETPFLTKSTPEGARDFLVPSRLNPGCFFALPQSPQLFKQILMIGGLDKYYQIVRCFRDEDLRADRQPEFTQVDIEMSFISEEDIISLIEGMMAELFSGVLGLKIDLPLKRLTYKYAMENYGTDAPDTRFDLTIKDITGCLSNSQFKVFSDTIKSGGVIKGINLKKLPLSRKELDELIEFAKDLGAKGLLWVKIQDDGWQSPASKFITDEEKREVEKIFQTENGDIIIFVADKPKLALFILGKIRVMLGKKYRLYDEKTFNLVWVTDFPLFEYDEEEKRLVSVHHPFTMPKDEDIYLLEKDPLNVRAKAYDIVLNGNEIGGGSLRIYQPALQKKIFELIGLSDEDAEKKFGFFLEALKFGAPPHGGIALGLDRIIMLMLGKESIRDVIAFPKTQKGTCLLTDAPSPVDDLQLRELYIKRILPKQ
ncbi:MAG: aspartate--tRNA ligase [Proteobacteria bacterium]|nr:aspartate--tRNA ligase [Pseudomonadota bacterium]